jgi:hypothetical protein
MEAPPLHSLASAPLPPRMRPGHVQHLCECTNVGIELRSQAARSIRTLLTEIPIPQRVPHPAWIPTSIHSYSRARWLRTPTSIPLLLPLPPGFDLGHVLPVWRECRNVGLLELTRSSAAKLPAVFVRSYTKIPAPASEDRQRISHPPARFLHSQVPTPRLASKPDCNPFAGLCSRLRPKPSLANSHSDRRIRCRNVGAPRAGKSSTFLHNLTPRTKEGGRCGCEAVTCTAKANTTSSGNILGPHFLRSNSLDPQAA